MGLAGGAETAESSSEDALKRTSQDGEAMFRQTALIDPAKGSERLEFYHE